MEDHYALLTARQAAGRLGITTRELYALIHSRVLAAYKMGRDLRLHQGDVEDYRRHHRSQ